MAIFYAGGAKIDADLIVFDKDGLMFESEQFWVELANTRCRRLAETCTVPEVLEWAKLMGADTVYREGEGFVTTYCDPLGILAVASPFEERSITGGFLVEKHGVKWHEGRDEAISVFADANERIDLSRALKPQPGYVALMQGLMAKDFHYGVATSDTYERTRDSMTLYGCFDKVRFVVTPEDVAEGKPAPDMLNLICEREGVAKNRTVMIGDSYVDVKMAKNAGCIGIGVSADPEMREKMKPFATVILSSLEEITLP